MWVWIWKHFYVPLTKLLEIKVNLWTWKSGGILTRCCKFRSCKWYCKAQWPAPVQWFSELQNNDQENDFVWTVWSTVGDRVMHLQSYKSIFEVLILIYFKLGLKVTLETINTRKIVFLESGVQCLSARLCHCISSTDISLEVWLKNTRKFDIFILMIKRSMRITELCKNIVLVNTFKYKGFLQPFNFHFSGQMISYVVSCVFFCLYISYFPGIVCISVSSPGTGYIQYCGILIRCLRNRCLNGSLPSCK